MELRAFLDFLFRRAWIIAGSVLLMLLGAVVVLLLAPKQYTATAKLSYRVEGLDTASMLLAKLELQQLSASTDRVDPEYHIERIKSAPLCLELIETLELKDRKGETLEWEDLLNRPPFVSTLLPKPYLSVVDVEDSQILRFSGTSTDPAQAAAIANTMVRLYVRESVQRRMREYREALDFLAGQLEQRRGEYAAALHKVRDYRIERRLLDSDAQASQAIDRRAEILTAMDETVSTMAENVATMVTLRSQLGRLGVAFTGGSVLSENSLILELKNQINEHKAELSGLRQRVTPLHPDYKEVQAKIDALTAELEHEVKVQTQTASQLLELEQNQESLKVRLAELEVTLAANDAVFAEHPVKDAGLMLLVRQMEEKEDIMSNLTATYERVLSAAALTMSHFWVPQEALEPAADDTSSPRKGMSLALALFFGTLFGLALAYARDVTDDTPRSREAYRCLGAPLLGVTPRRGMLGRLLHRRRRASHADSAFAPIRHNLALLLPEERPQTLVVAGDAPGSGSTALVTELALSLAAEGRRVLLVGAGAQPDAAARPGGLQDVLAGRRPLREAVTTGPGPGVDLLTGAAKAPLPTREGLRSLLEQAQGQYDAVLADAAPLSRAAQTLPVIRELGNLVLVLDHAKTANGRLLELRELLEHADIRPLGVVVNRAPRLK